LCCAHESQIDLLKLLKMKKQIILSVIGFVLSTAVHAQLASIAISTEIISDQLTQPVTTNHVNGNKKSQKSLKLYEPTVQTRAMFAEDFDNVPVAEWKQVDNFDEACFTQNGKRYSAFYDADNNLVATTSGATFEDLPMRAQDYIDTKYAGFVVDQVIYYDDNEFNETDMVLFSQPFQDEDSYFAELSNGTQRVVLHVYLNGDVSLFKAM